MVTIIRFYFLLTKEQNPTTDMKRRKNHLATVPSADNASVGDAVSSKQPINRPSAAVTTVSANVVVLEETLMD